MYKYINSVFKRRHFLCIKNTAIINIMFILRISLKDTNLVYTPNNRFSWQWGLWHINFGDTGAPKKFYIKKNYITVKIFQVIGRPLIPSPIFVRFYVFDGFYGMLHTYTKNVINEVVK